MTLNYIPPEIIEGNITVKLDKVETEGECKMEKCTDCLCGKRYTRL